MRSPVWDSRSVAWHAADNVARVIRSACVAIASQRCWLTSSRPQGCAVYCGVRSGSATSRSARAAAAPSTICASSFLEGSESSKYVCAQAVASDDRIHRFRFDPIALCSDSLVVQFHETPATDFGADPRTGMGELLGYLFDTDYTGAARVPLTKRYTLCARVAIVTD